MLGTEKTRIILDLSVSPALVGILEDRKHHNQCAKATPDVDKNLFFGNRGAGVLRFLYGRICGGYQLATAIEGTVTDFRSAQKGNRSQIIAVEEGI